ncbi:MAG: hypothetical protein QOH51_1887 [Acidobacteriota bacterium]|jgi:Tfp pilus assembly protein PilX|nr:hypothetical protein [Acidobacteriota bacterium]
MRKETFELSRRRAGERGAALITALLVSMLMLAAGGALILTTGLGASNAVDSSAEAQAYYAAESGLQTALSVVRRNVTTAGAPAVSFRSLVCETANPCTNAGNNLSSWLTYTNNAVQLSSSPSLSFTLSVSDASKNSGDILVAGYGPRFLLVRSVGHGPKGATKALEMMLDDYAFDFKAQAAITIRSNDVDTTGMSAFSLGNSNPHTWTGNDLAGLAPAVPAFAVTNTQDYDAGDGFGLGTVQGTGEKAIGGDAGNVFGPAQLSKLSVSSLETWLQNATNARAFLTTMRAKAVEMGRFNPGDLGTEASPKFTFIDGDLSLGGGDHGAGLLIVTGNITQAGSSSFKGITMALGNGNIDRKGTPDEIGAMVVANFEHNYDSTTQSYKGTGGFGSPSITSAGGGNSLVGYNSDWVRKAMEALGSTVVGVVER